MIELLLAVSLKGSLALAVLAEWALLLNDNVLLALAGVPAVTIMYYATVSYARGARGSGTE